MSDPSVNVFPGEAGHYVEAGLAFGAHRVRHLLDQPRSQHQETYQICEATTPMARAKAQQQDEHESRVQEALRAIRGGLEGAVAAAVELYSIPRTSLYYRLSGERKTRREGHIDQQRLTVAEEKAITKWCFDMDDRGFPPRLDMMRDMASHLEMKRLGKMGEPFGKNWLSRFLDGNPSITVKLSCRLERQRTQANDPRIIKDFFAKLSRLIRTHGLKASQVFNVDEKGFLLGQAAHARVLCRRGRRNPNVTHDGGRELVTVAETVSAPGLVFSPLIIYRGTAQYLGWHKNLSAEEKDYVFSYSPKGWIDDRLALMWLEKIFEPQTAPLVGRLPRLLILDGHGSHLTFQFVQFCLDHSILLLCLPAHSTHLLQPLDVGLFAPYQHYYCCEVDDYQRSGHNSQTIGIKKSLFIRMVANARKKTFTSSNICKAFEGAGIWPLSAQKVLGKMRPEVSSRRDTFGLIATPRKSKDIRRRVQVAERLLDTGMASLSLKDDVQTMEHSSQVMITLVKTIMRELGHQWETEIAHRELY